MSRQRELASYLAQGARSPPRPERLRARAVSPIQSEVRPVRRHAGRQCVRAPNALKPRRDLAVIDVRMIAALAADELEGVGVASLCPAVHDPGRLTPEDCSGAVTGLARERKSRGVLAAHPQPRIAGIMKSPRCGDGIATGSRQSTRRRQSMHSNARVCAAHRPPRPLSRLPRLWCSSLLYFLRNIYYHSKMNPGKTSAVRILRNDSVNNFLAARILQRRISTSRTRR